MKNVLKIAVVLIIGTLIFSCVPRHKPHHVPPGQAKKIMKSKSARPYAPGQVKKVKGKKHPHPHKRRGR